MGGFILESEAFDNGGVIPRKCGYKNGNQSPPLKISGIPENTLSLALIMDDPDAMSVVGKVWVHWVLWNIDPSTMELKKIPFQKIVLKAKLILEKLVMVDRLLQIKNIHTSSSYTH